MSTQKDGIWQKVTGINIAGQRFGVSIQANNFALRLSVDNAINLTREFRQAWINIHVGLVGITLMTCKNLREEK
jgi:hypothetical protein